MSEPTRPADWIRPRHGRIRAWLVNLLLRLLVKRRMYGPVDVAAIRERQARLNARLAGGRSAKLLRDVDCDGVPAQWLGAPGRDNRRVLLHLHGGAFIARSPALHADMLAPWCTALGCAALLPQYRLAPEHPYPAALADCLRAYRWLLNQGYAPHQIALSGDSAGGNLALALLQSLKTQGEPLPGCAVLLSPFVDFTLSGASLIQEARRDPMFTADFAIDLRRRYVRAEQMLEPTVSPLFGDYAGLPPMLIQAGELEMLRDESVRLAGRAREAGVDVSLQIWAGLPHVFQAFALLPQAAEAGRHITDFIARHTARATDAARPQPEPTTAARAA